MSNTRRITVPELENIIGQKLPVGKEGFISVVDYLGTDQSIVEAARVSYKSGTKTLRDDISLIRYLMRHEHTSPFEFAEIVIHVRAPLFIARQWYRHRTANVNEISGRYSVLDSGHYIPETLNLQSSINKQSRNDDRPENETLLLDSMKESMIQSEKTYSDLIESGVAREIARGVLPMSTFTEWYWKIDLHNLLRLIKLRLHHSAQAEFTAYAKVLADIIKIWTPITYDAFVEYKLDSSNLSLRAISCNV